jgi:hypothetical protein
MITFRRVEVSSASNIPRFVRRAADWCVTIFLRRIETTVVYHDEQGQRTMAITLAKLEKYFVVEKLIFHSIDLSLYQVSAIIEGQEQYVSDSDGKLLRSFNLVELQKQLRSVDAQERVLRHTSAYDEMIGGPEKTSGNLLEVRLADNQLY